MQIVQVVRCTGLSFRVVLIQGFHPLSGWVFEEARWRL